MVDPKILAKFGCSEERLKMIFTTKVTKGDKDNYFDGYITEGGVRKKCTSNEGIRRRFENFIRSAMYQTIPTNLANANKYQAVDMANDAQPIQEDTFPFMLWARGKLKTENLWSALEASGCTPEKMAKFVKRGKGGKVLNVSVPRISEISIDIVKSYKTRRHAAMDALWSNLWPLYNYETYGKEPVARLRADILTQRVQQISNAYNYRHHDSQCRGKMLDYGFCLSFVEGPWDRQMGWQFERTNTGADSEKPETFIKVEGLKWIDPHPSRIGYDMEYPLADINSDTGPKWLFYWDVKRFGSIASCDHFYNLKEVYATNQWESIVDQFSHYFGYYYSDPCVLSYPDAKTSDPSIFNDRKTRIGRYGDNNESKGCLVAPFFWKINPKEEGIGDYDGDVWIQIFVAGDCTIIGARFLPSKPACYGAINWNDGRAINQSMCMALLGYQDHASMIMTQCIQQLRAAMRQLVLIDTSSLDSEVAKALKEGIEDPDYWIDPVTLMYDASKLLGMGIQSPANAFVIVQNQINNVFQSALTALTQLLDLADRLLVLSPNELGQPNPREVSAQEVSSISGSVQAVYSFINQGPREMIAAKKEIIYESMLAYANPTFRVAVEGQYLPSTLKLAGFAYPTSEKLGMDYDSASPLPARTTVIGNLRDLRYDYYFDSRDGAERSNDPQAAATLTQLLQAVQASPKLEALVGDAGIAKLFNYIIQCTGTGVPFQVEVPDGGVQTSEDPTQAIQQEQAMAMQGTNDQRLRQLEMVVSQLQGALSAMNQRGQVPPQQVPAQQMPPGPAPVAA